jgi:hypothetical protein
MRRLRYIWGGDEGSEARGSEDWRGGELGGVEDVELMTPEEGILRTSLSGEGAPLTSWSSLASDIFR